MNKRLNQLREALPYKNNIVTDPKTIEYLIGTYYECGERLLALLIMDEEITLVLNALFSPTPSINTIVYRDDENPITLIKNKLDGKDLGVDGNWLTKFSLQFIPEFTLHDISPHLEYQRAIKDSNEQKLLKEASLLNDKVMIEMKNHLKIGVTEKELAQKIKELQSTPPLSGISFEPIVVFTENIADPHGIPSDRKLTKDDVVLIDMGGIYKGYVSDMTRVYFMNENPLMEKLYSIVLEANEKAIKAIKPGKTFKEIDTVARDVITNAGYGPYFTHRLGHGVGIDVHETLDVSQANETIIEEGMCFSIEPGIYIENVGGIRIEDLVCVTKDGVNVLNELDKSITYIK